MLFICCAPGAMFAGREGGHGDCDARLLLLRQRLDLLERQARECPVRRRAVRPTSSAPYSQGRRSPVSGDLRVKIVAPAFARQVLHQ